MKAQRNFCAAELAVATYRKESAVVRRLTPHAETEGEAGRTSSKNECLSSAFSKRLFRSFSNSRRCAEPGLLYELFFTFFCGLQIEQRYVAEVVYARNVFRYHSARAILCFFHLPLVHQSGRKETPGRHIMLHESIDAVSYPKHAERGSTADVSGLPGGGFE